MISLTLLVKFIGISLAIIGALYGVDVAVDSYQLIEVIPQEVPQTEISVAV